MANKEFKKNKVTFKFCLIAFFLNLINTFMNSDIIHDT